jgi:hypothetical protein
MSMEVVKYLKGLVMCQGLYLVLSFLSVTRSRLTYLLTFYRTAIVTDLK